MGYSIKKQCKEEKRTLTQHFHFSEEISIIVYFKLTTRAKNTIKKNDKLLV